MKLDSRIAIEALRAGVPNRTAIRMMGTEQALIEKTFDAALERAWEPDRPPGFGIAGGFGAGKSHLLGYLAEVARAHRAVVSRVAISKETPLANPTAVFAAAVRNAELPDSADDALGACLAALREQPDRLEALEAEIAAADSGFAPIFVAMLRLLGRAGDASGVVVAFERMLAGGRLSAVWLRDALRDAGIRGRFAPTRADARELPAQRLAFLPRLFAAAGYGPWCLFLDEVELIGRYSALQRGLAYAELAGWLGLSGTIRPPGLVSLFAVTDDFTASVVAARSDAAFLPERLRLKGREAEARLVAAGIEAIARAEREHRLALPTEAELARCHDRLRTLYTQAYDWPAPALPPPVRTGSRTMRHYIKGWVTQWDLARLLGRSGPLVTETLAINYTEDTSLESAPDDIDDADAV
ncbi:MAG: BREX system ATP-binding domain-containing protein [Acetobacteraceae bacterium]